MEGPLSPQKAITRIDTPAEAISATTAGLSPESIPFIISRFLNLKYTYASIDTIIQDGRTLPKVAIREPCRPATLVPTKVAAFIAMGPGVISAMVIRSVNSLRVSHEFKLTTWFCIRGMEAIPPPMLNRPT